MSEQDQGQSALGAGEASSLPAASKRRSHRRKRCDQCSGPFGLTRRRRAGKQFCSAKCMELHADGVRKAVEARARWLELLYQTR